MQLFWTAHFSLMGGKTSDQTCDASSKGNTYLSTLYHMRYICACSTLTV